MRAERIFTMGLFVASLLASAGRAQLALPYEDSVFEPGSAFRINNTYVGTTPSYGGYFQAAGANGRGVYGRCTNTVPDVNTYGGFFYAAGPKGRGVFGQSAGTQEGIGVKGWASNNGDVQNFGGHFCATGSRGIGVYGFAENIGAGAVNYGGYFQADGGRGIGVCAVGGPGGCAGEFQGDLKIAGTGAGIVFADGSRQMTAATSTSASPAPGRFPRPAYNSGWVSLPWSGHPPQTIELTHNLGGDPNNYVVDLQFRYLATVEVSGAIHNEGHGGDGDTDSGWNRSTGAYYNELNATSVRITAKGPTYWAPRARIRIWVCE